MKKRLILTLIIPTIILGGLVGCGNKDIEKPENTVVESETVEITEYSYGYDAKNVLDMTEKEIIDLFGKPLERKKDKIDGDKRPIETKILKYENMEFIFIGDTLCEFVGGDNNIHHLRGVKIGDSIDSILEKFPTNDKEKNRLVCDREYSFAEGMELEYELIYGTFNPLEKSGIVLYEKGTDNIVAVVLTDVVTSVEILFNEASEVNSVNYKSNMF